MSECGSVSSRQVRVVYPDHHAMIGDRLWACVQARRGTDWTLQCGERTIQAHRLILELFLTPEKLTASGRGPAIKAEEMPEAEEQTENVGVGNLDSLVEFLYRGEVTLPEDQLDGLSQTAKELDLHVLVEAVETAAAGESEPFVVHRNNLGQSGRRRRGSGRTSSSADSFRLSGRGGRRPAGWSDEVEMPDNSENGSDCEESGESDHWDLRVKNMKMEPAEELVAMDSDDGDRLCEGIIRSVDAQSEDDDDEGISGNIYCLPPDMVGVDGVDNRRSTRRPRSKGPPKIYRCPHCEYASPDYKPYTRHLMSTHRITPRGAPAPKYKCGQCDYESLRRNDIHRHQQSTHMKSRPFKCSNCSFGASRMGALTRHMEVVHGMGPSRYPCETCGKRCHSQAALVLHIRTHTKEKPFLCEHCPSAFSRDVNLKNHVDVVHGLGVSRFVCETCGKQCASHSKLICHGRTHTKEKPFQCPHCSHAASRKVDLKKHVDVVHQLGDSKYACGTCGKRCGSKAVLALHERTHTHEKPFKCPHCSYATGQNGNLKNHVDVVHGLGASRFTCDTCGKRCPSRSELAMHVKTHTKEKPFKCQMCAYACSHSSNLRKHLKKVHKVTTFGPEVTTAGLTVDQ